MEIPTKCFVFGVAVFASATSLRGDTLTIEGSLKIEDELSVAVMSPPEDSDGAIRIGNTVFREDVRVGDIESPIPYVYPSRDFN